MHALQAAEPVHFYPEFGQPLLENPGLSILPVDQYSTVRYSAFQATNFRLFTGLNLTSILEIPYQLKGFFDPLKTSYF